MWARRQEREGLAEDSVQVPRFIKVTLPTAMHKEDPGGSNLVLMH